MPVRVIGCNRSDRRIHELALKNHGQDLVLEGLAQALPKIRRLLSLFSRGDQIHIEFPLLPLDVGELLLPERRLFPVGRTPRGRDKAPLPEEGIRVGKRAPQVHKHTRFTHVAGPVGMLLLALREDLAHGVDARLVLTTGNSTRMREKLAMVEREILSGLDILLPVGRGRRGLARQNERVELGDERWIIPVSRPPTALKRQTLIVQDVVVPHDQTPNPRSHLLAPTLLRVEEVKGLPDVAHAAILEIVPLHLGKPRHGADLNVTRNLNPIRFVTHDVSQSLSLKREE